MRSYSVKVGKDLYQKLQAEGLLEYGSVVPGKFVMDTLELAYPKTGTRQSFKEIDLFLLSSIDYVRNVLLGKGRYFASSGGDYRVLLPSDNVKQCERYMSSANKKLSRAIKLSRNTPGGNTKSEINSVHVRAVMRRDSIQNDDFL